MVAKRMSRQPVVEHALLQVLPDKTKAFEAAFIKAAPLISAAPGFIDLQLLRGLETPHTYLLLVHWRTVADHEKGFRQSPAYQEWRRLLHHFYDPFPQVAHFSPVT
jgi:heme-degrading monooxygenase HmoA